jgi:hypothetical protein
MVALVILGFVVVACLQVVGGATRLAGDERVWTQAVAYAEDAMEATKIAATPAAAASPRERLAGGFERWVDVRPWADSLVRVTVVVALPGGGQYALDRLARAR